MARRPSKLTPEQARALLAKWDHEDPLKHYRPSLTQQAFHASSSRHRMLNSVTQGGKSAAACVELAYMLRGIHPFRPSYGPVKIIQFCASRFQAAEVIGLKLFKDSKLLLPHAPQCRGKPMIPDREIKDFGTQRIAGMEIPYRVELKNGSVIFFRWSGVLDMWQGIQGIEVDGIAVDEDVGTEQLWSEIPGRLLATGSDPNKPWAGFTIWSATNTETNPAFDAYYERAEKRLASHELFIIPPGETGAIDAARREEMGQMISEEENAIRNIGSVNAGSFGRIYPQFDMKRHVVPDYEPQPDDNIWLGWDPGIKDQFGLMFFCLHRDRPRTVRVIDFFHERGKTLDYQANLVARWLQGRSLEGMIVDPQANKRDYSRGQPQIDLFTDILYEQLKIVSHRGVLFGRNIIKDGVEQVRRYLDPDPENPEAEPLIQINERALYVAQQLAKVRLKPRSHALRHDTIEGKDLEVFDLTRYIVSRQPYWHQRAPNLPTWVALTATANPPPISRIDPFALRDDMSEAERTHVIRLRESCRMMEDIHQASGRGGRQMDVRFVNI